MWPGFGDNARVLDWILRRCDNEDIAQDSAIGKIPKPGTININGLFPIPDMEQLFHLPKDFWTEEVILINSIFSIHIIYYAHFL